MKLTPVRGRCPLIAAAGLLAAGALSACGGNASSDGLDEIKSVTFPGAYYLTDVVADEKGFFEDEGLDVEFIKPQSGTTSTQLMESGQIPLMINDGVLTITAQDKGLGLSMIGSLYNRSAWTIYAADDDPDLAGTADENPAGIGALEGKSIGVTGINAGTDLALQSVLEANDLDPESDVNRLGVGLLTSAIGQFSNGGIDAYVFGDPAGEMLADDDLAHPFYSVSESDEAAANVVQGGLVASTKWLESDGNREIAERWVTAHQKALDWIQDPENLQEAGELFAEAFGGTPEGGAEAVTNLIENIYPHNLDGLKVPRAEYENSIGLLAELGQLSDTGPSYEDAVDSIGQE